MAQQTFLKPIPQQDQMQGYNSEIIVAYNHLFLEPFSGPFPGTGHPDGNEDEKGIIECLFCHQIDLVML